jgi:uncharacterized protein (TIRG00374 family)
MKKMLGNWKIMLGLAISAVFMYLAFRKVKFGEMWSAFSEANYWYVIPAIAVVFVSHWLRALRWQYLLAPVKKIDVATLFSSLLIGYMANSFLPAHLGEFLRAYMVGKKQPVSASAVFGTIVTERIIDVFTMFLLMAVAMILFPFPEQVRKSGYIVFVLILALFAVLVVMKKHPVTTFKIVEKMISPLPDGIGDRIGRLFHSFLEGIVPLTRRKHYIFVVLLSIVIWACYAYIFQLLFYAFDFVAEYSLPWSASLVLLVITTFSILIPSSPGYVGTYHYLCVYTLGLFPTPVPESQALSFAFVAHGINFLPILIVGLLLISAAGMSISSLQRQANPQRAD